VHLLDRTERPLDPALRAGCGVSAVRLGRQVGEDAHAEAAHHRLEHTRAADRTVVHVDRHRQTLERKFRLRLGRKGVEQEAQRRFRVLAIDAAIFLIDHARTVIDDREQHQRRFAAPLLDPQRRFNMLEVGWANAIGDAMTDFPRPILNYWHEAFAGRSVGTGSNLSLVVSETLNGKRPAMMLEGADGLTRAALMPELADRIGAGKASDISIDGLRELLTEAGVSLHDPDFLFYLPADGPRVPAAHQSNRPRQLTNDDRTAFDAFQACASEQDLEDSWVELDHWAVFGCFDGDRLVSAASMYLWENGPLADLGVLTLADARGKGHARAVVQAINQHSRHQGYEPQYRCQLENHASVALANACGLALFGKWVVASSPEDPAS